MNGHDHPRPTGARWPGRRLTLLGLAFVLAGCGGGGAVSTGSPELGTPVSATSAGSGARVAGGSGNAGSAGTSPGTTSGATSAEDPGVTVNVGGPMLFVPHLILRSESFGEVAVGAVSPPRGFQVRSQLPHPATVVALEPGDARFQITEDRCTGATLPPDGSGGCTVTVAFSPRETGQATTGMTVRMTHTCTSDGYIPCSWTPEQIAAPGTVPNFTRVVLPSGQVRFDWTTRLGVQLVGQGVGTAAPTTPPAT